jgi:hypothetical protein
VKIVIEPTGESAAARGIPCRLWRGTTEHGISLVVFVAAIAVPQESDCEELAVLLEVEPDTIGVTEHLRAALTRIAEGGK